MILFYDWIPAFTGMTVGAKGRWRRFDIQPGWLVARHAGLDPASRAVVALEGSGYRFSPV